MIRIRRERREIGGSGPKKGMSVARLVLLLMLVIFLIWWMNQVGG